MCVEIVFLQADDIYESVFGIKIEFFFLASGLDSTRTSSSPAAARGALQTAIRGRPSAVRGVNYVPQNPIMAAFRGRGRGLITPTQQIGQRSTANDVIPPPPPHPPRFILRETWTLTGGPTKDTSSRKAGPSKCSTAPKPPPSPRRVSGNFSPRLAMIRRLQGYLEEAQERRNFTDSMMKIEGKQVI
jgi:hypothetical protein